MNKSSLNRLSIITALSDSLFFYCQRCTKYETQLHKYGIKDALGEDIRLRPVDIHLLTEIINNKGISSFELADIFKRTRSSISQRIKVLLEYDLIRKVPRKDNYKIYSLYPTDRGIIVGNCHDKSELDFSFSLLEKLSNFSNEDIEKCMQIIDIVGNGIECLD